MSANGGAVDALAAAVRYDLRSRGIRPNTDIVVKQAPDETGAQAMARMLLEPHFRHAASASTYSGKAFGSDVELPGVTDFVDHLEIIAEKAENGDLAIVSRLLASQAITLDSMFTELSRRAALNMGDYINATERYGRLALKAQSNCRATLEALERLHQPREQTVKHVHVNEGGQAIVADQFHHDAGVKENEKSVKQSDATGAAGTISALPSPDPFGNGMPVPGSEGKAALQDARRDKSGGT